ncbi:hypothetical protein Ait01nite_068530 [Actinoplanes italicus]|uniref:Phosphodiesterase n=1 Tax=Actinoplanes italicus TaxID=113567 RepID=A0A2T0K1H5_9ACTN|nr:hypothetical protein [Actinoplanes italicus]PRX16600.1 hypothetical protein CLV67_119181 [Actinoplanes italicus]GIE33808.1 hypothetical protein Ait01nite_068530 [Actinoplanes italicus]
MTWTPLVGIAVAAALGVRLARARRQRALHPLGRSMTGELEIWGCPEAIGAEFIDRPGRYAVVVRLSKGLGTRRGRADVRGIAIRIPRPEGPFDLLLSTVGPGRWGRRVPMPRRTFDAMYGSIAAYRAGMGRLYLAAGPDPDGTPVGDDVERLGQRPADLLLYAVRADRVQTFGRVRLGDLLARDTDAALAFDPIRNSSPDLYPTGLLHGVRAVAYRASQRWRGAGQDCKAT